MKFSEIKRNWLNGYLDQLKDKGISKAEIARRLGILPQSLNNILNGNRGITDSFIDSLLEAFESEPVELKITTDSKSPLRQTMKVTFHATDTAEVRNAVNEDEAIAVTNLLNGLELELGYFPKKGDNLSFMIGDYSIDAQIYDSYLNYCQPGNPHYVESWWGTHYDVHLEDIEIIERHSCDLK